MSLVRNFTMFDDAYHIYIIIIILLLLLLLLLLF